MTDDSKTMGQGSDSAVVNPAGHDDPNLDEVTQRHPAYHRGLTHWDPYTNIEFLGQGGMGTVYRAHDTTLDRPVAIKLLRGDSPAHATRFFREARSQARVKHPNVCGVYEAGEREGQPYIIMQFINGCTLDLAARSMTLEQRVAVISDVAEAIQAAHSLGLIHRDLKPGNIMVETTKEGDLKPFVLDFGLVRDEAAPSETRTGEILGTPAYMSPEQILGDVHRIDRRSDVYSLGAVLYQLLVGVPPFTDVTSVHQLVRVLEEEPPRPRHIDPQIPLDLETIVLKCLEKEPRARYTSARALADDLRRYLEGEPIEARRMNSVALLLRKARKNRGLVAAVVIVVAVTLTAAGITIRTRWVASRQASLARTFGQDAKDMEWTMRVAKMSPIHDLHREIALIRQRMDSVTRRMDEVGSLADAPGHYALGRGYLALGEYVAAHDHLDQSWQLDNRQPEVAYALGLSLVQLYQRELEIVRSEPNPRQRVLRQRQVEEKYRQPVLDRLGASRGAEGVAPEYLEGLIAVFEERYDDGLEKAAKAIERLPWLYEGWMLEGHLHAARARDLRTRGLYEPALHAFSAAEEAFNRAVAVGSSDADVYEGLCQLRVDMMMTDQAVAAEHAEAFLAKAVAACDLALEVDPQRATAFTAQATGLRLLGAIQAGRGLDPVPSFELAATRAKQAIVISPDLGRGHESLGAVLVEHARFEFAHGRDPRPLLKIATASLDASARCKPARSSVFDWKGAGLRLQAWFEWARGLDPLPSWQAAIAGHKTAHEINPASPVYLGNLADVYSTRANYEVSRGGSADEDIEQAIELYGRAIEINPSDGDIHAGLGSVNFIRAEAALLTGRDPTSFTELSVLALLKARSLTPANDYAAFALGYAHLLQAEFELREGSDPSSPLGLALESLTECVELNPSNAYASAQIINVHRIDSAYRLTTGGDPETAFRLGQEAGRRALVIDATLSDAHRAIAELELVWATWLRRRGRNPSNTFRKAHDSVQSAIESSPNDARNHCVLAAVLAEEADWLVKNERSTEAVLKRGLSAAAHAIEINPTYERALALRRWFES